MCAIKEAHGFITVEVMAAHDAPLMFTLLA